MPKLAGRDLMFVVKNTICYIIMNYKKATFCYNPVFKLEFNVSVETLTLLFSGDS